MPALSKIKEQARIVICKSNLHQYSLAARMYLDDNGRRFPDSLEWIYSERPSGYCMWHDEENNLNRHPECAGVFWAYLPDMDIHLCPTFRMVAKHCYDSGHDPSIPVVAQYNYSQNAFVGGDGEGAVSNESEVKHPARVFLYSEENPWSIPGLSGCGINDNNLRHGIPPDIVDCFGTYHNAPSGDLNKGSANLLFVDGHVDSITAEEQKDFANFKLAWPRSTPPSE